MGGPSSDTSAIHGITRPYVGRFAPSPTGPLHFGSLLAAVGSYLQARVANGTWLIRIEDLDFPRVVSGAADDIVRTLAAFGFEWHDAIQFQSQRLDHYAAAIAQLKSNGQLYSCSCSRAQIAASQPVSTTDNSSIIDPEEIRYPGTCRYRVQAHTSVTALRLIVAPEVITLIDAIQNPYAQNVAASTGDFIVQRRDGIYAYHLAVVVDDAAQGISEVVRGADLLTSTPRQILLQRALQLPTPAYVHLPLALDTQGRKLSKSSQSLPIDARAAGPILWQALAALRQSPPATLRHAPLTELWAWAIANWSLTPLSGVAACPAVGPTQ